MIQYKKYLLKFSIGTCLYMMSAVAFSGGSDSTKWYSLHFQLTTITQNHNTFPAPYEGPKSLQQKESPSTSLTATLYAAVKLGRNTTAVFNPEVAGGAGMSGATGIAGFPNGETFRVGNPKPTPLIARAYLHHILPLSSHQHFAEEDQNTVAAQVPDKYLAFSAGKLALADFFDDNTYSHDPRTQFMNWALMDAGAYDYAADVRGYTMAFVGEYITPKFEFRTATALLPIEANGAELNWNYGKSYSWQSEAVFKPRIADNTANLRVLGFYNHAAMANYAEATDKPPFGLEHHRSEPRSKAGFAIGYDQPFSKNIGVFSRLSYNDGQNETWCFTEIDQSVTAGLVWHNIPWLSYKDHAGFALIANGISNDHRRYLAAGGNGFMIGDGQLNYGTESIAELYYSLQVLVNHLWITPDYQFVINPAYNKDRGPVHVIGLRLHTEW